MDHRQQYPSDHPSFNLSYEEKCRAAEAGAVRQKQYDTSCGTTAAPPTPVARLVRAIQDGRHSFLAKTDFGAAIEALREGFQLARRGWNGKGMHIALQVPDLNSKMTQPYIYMKTADDALVPWVASQSDMLAHDWEIVG